MFIYLIALLTKDANTQNNFLQDIVIGSLGLFCSTISDYNNNTKSCRSTGSR